MVKKCTESLSPILANADARGMYLEHTAYFGDTPSLRPVVERSPQRIKVRLSRRLYGMPPEAIRETFENVYKRIEDPSLPRFGPLGTEYIQSERCIKFNRKLMTSVRFRVKEDRPRRPLLVAATKARRMLSDPICAFNLRMLDIDWRQEAFSLDEEFIASTDPLMQAIRVDARLSQTGIPQSLIDYVVFREMAMICAFDFGYASVNREFYEQLVSRYPRAERMEQICEKLRWEFTVPVRKRCPRRDATR